MSAREHCVKDNPRTFCTFLRGASIPAGFSKAKMDIDLLNPDAKEEMFSVRQPVGIEIELK